MREREWDIAGRRHQHDHVHCPFSEGKYHLLGAKASPFCHALLPAPVCVYDFSRSLIDYSAPSSSPILSDPHTGFILQVVSSCQFIGSVSSLTIFASQLRVIGGFLFIGHTYRVTRECPCHPNN